MEEEHWILCNKETREEFTITEEAFQVGRSNGLDIVCTANVISRNHAFFIKNPNGTLHVQDNGSANGTYVNGRKIESKVLHQLKINDEVGLGLHSNLNLADIQGVNQNDPKYIFIIKKLLQTIVLDDNTDENKSVTTNSNSETPSTDSLTSQNLLKTLDSNCNKQNNGVIPNLVVHVNGSAVKSSTKCELDIKMDEMLKIKEEPGVVQMEKEPEIINIKEEPNEKEPEIINIKEEPNDSANINIKQEADNYDSSQNNNGYTIEDGYIVINDDEEEFPCSQLFNDKSISNNVDQDFANDSIFCNIKKELEELDKPDEGKIYAFVDLVDSDAEGSYDWLSDKQSDADQNIEENCMEIDKNNQLLVEYKESKPNHNNGNSSWKYVKPPVIAPHVEVKNKSYRKNERSSSTTTEKRKHDGKEKDQDKKIKIDTFHDSKGKDLMWKCKPQKLINTDRRESIQEIRKKKLKEIAQKEHEEEDKKIKTTKAKTATAKVKVSDSRGKFLTENYEMPSTSRCRTVSSDPAPKLKSYKETTSLGGPANSILHSVQPHPNQRKTTLINNNVVDNCKLIPYVPKAIIPTTTATTNNAMNEWPRNCRDIQDIIIKILHWNAIWFDERKHNQQLPPINDEPVTRMCQNFSSYAHYYKTVKPVFELELWNHLYKGMYEDEPRKKVFLAKIERETKRSNYIELDCLTYITKEQNEHSYYVKEEDVVILQMAIKYNQISTVPNAILGYITHVGKKLLQEKDFIDFKFGTELRIIAPHGEVTFKILVKPYKGLAIQKKNMHIRVVASLIPSTRVIRSVKYLERSPLCKHVLQPTFALYKVPTLNQEKLFSDANLNLEQYRAVIEASHVCLRNEPGIYLIQGPPGTGKSTVIISIIQQILFHGLTNRNGSKQGCILVVAPSNVAVDELTLKLINLKGTLEDHYRKEIKLVRLGPKNMIHRNVQKYSLLELAKQHIDHELVNSKLSVHKELYDLRTKIALMSKNCNTSEREYELNAAKIELTKLNRKAFGRSYNENYKKAEEELLNGARIVCTTLSSCVGMRMEEVFGRESNKISCCIVDEATQSREQETLIPLKLGISKLVLVGDPKQLPAVTLSKEAKELAHGQSLFSRIMSHFEGKPNNPIKMLTMQYRMHPAICEFPSKAYYGGRLKNSLTVRNRLSKLDILKPYLIFSFKTEFSNNQEYLNAAEIDCVIKLLDAIVHNVKESCSYSVGVVTPYNHQKGGIIAKIKEKIYKPNVSITVNTVDSFQGQEKHVIIMSCVRDISNTFIDDEQRLNVAITRAKNALYIIGSQNLLQTSEVLGKMYDDARRRCLIKSINYKTPTTSLAVMIKS